MQQKKKIIIVIVAIVLALVLIGGTIGLYALSVSIYAGSFNYRCQTSEQDAFALADFPALSRDRHTFATMQGHTLVGYLYKSTDVPAPKAVIVFAHGMGGGGQTGYMDIFDFFCARGYYVFAYDATANDESEGEVMGGLPQGFIDLDYAITYAQSLDELQDLPFMLMGYSWGGLSVVNALNTHPEVDAVASLAGWNKSMNMIDHRGCQMVGPVAKLLLPFASVYEFFEYGSYAFSTGMKGFGNSDCAVMIVHGEQDDTIPIDYGYGTYYEKYAGDPRFTFKKYPDRDHGVMTLEDGSLDLALMAEIAAFFDAQITK